MTYNLFEGQSQNIAELTGWAWKNVDITKSRPTEILKRLELELLSIVKTYNLIPNQKYS